jgi:hypothetical protein
MTRRHWGHSTVAIALLLFLVPQGAFAHEARELGKYNISFGWRVEPAFVGVPNGPEFRVALLDNADQPIEGRKRRSSSR